jgi:hypothetical protein
VARAFPCGRRAGVCLRIWPGPPRGSPGDDCRVHLLLGPDPLVGVVPAHLRFVPERHVVDVEEDLIAALFVPDLEARVAGVLKDGPNRDLRPGATGADSVGSCSRSFVVVAPTPCAVDSARGRPVTSDVH